MAKAKDDIPWREIQKRPRPGTRFTRAQVRADVKAVIAARLEREAAEKAAKRAARRAAKADDAGK
jgi:hypothetical protein